MADSKALTVYSFQHVAVVMDGRQVTGLWEGNDAVAIAQNSDIGVPLVGVDGAAIVSITADRAVRITIKLQPTSPQHAWLQNRVRQMRNNGSLLPFSISIRDTGNNEGGSSSDVTIIQEPTHQYGEEAQSRDWVLFAQNWEPTQVSYAA